MSQVPAVMNNVTAAMEIFKEFASESSVDQVSRDLSNIMLLITSNIVRENSQETRERLFSYFLQLKSIDRLFKDLNEQLAS